VLCGQVSQYQRRACLCMFGILRETDTIGKQRISSNSDILQITFTHSDYSRTNSFHKLVPTPTTRPGSGSSISSKYVGIIRSLATKRTLGIRKLLKCINKALQERSWNRSHVIIEIQLRSWCRSHAYENRELLVRCHSFLQEICSPEFFNKRTIPLQTSWEAWQQFINFLSVTHQRPGTAHLTNQQSVLPQDQNSRSEVSGILRNYV